MKQRDFAIMLGTTDTTISRIINGQRKPSHTLVLRIEKLTGIPREKLRPDIYTKRAE
jgi:DNA-binding transcriptional regulator YdaS (Cro superfamily)